MGEWWYAAGTQRNGPTDDETLKRLLQNNTISTDTLVWREGLEEWTPLGSESTLAHLLKAVPPPLPDLGPRVGKPRGEPDAGQANATPPADHPASGATPALVVNDEGTAAKATAATAWRRWFARVFDLWIEVIIVLVLLFLASQIWPAATLARMRTPAGALVLTFGLLPAALVLDACIHALFGNSPGKALLRVSVVTATQERPAWMQYLARNLSMWVGALAFGLPLVSLFTMAYQAHRLGHGRATTYDADDFQVIQRRLGWLRRLVFAVAFVSLLFLNVIFSIIAGHVDRIERYRTPARVSAETPHHAQPSTSTAPAAAAAAGVVPHDGSSNRCPEHFYGGAGPIIGNSRVEASARDLCYQGAAVTYSPVTYTPLWSAEHLTAAKLKKAAALSFMPDAREELGLPQPERASAADFEMDTYSAVPLTPPTRLPTALARIQSSTFASIVPMKHDGLARRWTKLGDTVAERARRGGDVYTISGTLFEGKTLSQLNNRLLVPTGFYLAFFDARAHVAEAYILGNSEGAQVRKIGLTDLERRAGLILFPKLPKDLYSASVPKTAKPIAQDAAADFTTCEKPKAPLVSIRNGEEGTSTLTFLVDANGALLDGKIKRSSGHPLLDAAALDAIKRCRFSPAKRDGVPFKSWTSVAYVWSLDQQ